MIIKNQEDVTRAVLAEAARAPDARFREILSAGIRHLHAFAREARLTEAEFHQLCGVIARLGQATTASASIVPWLVSIRVPPMARTAVFQRNSTLC